MAVIAYELRLAEADGPAEPAPLEPARHATLEALWERTAALLCAAGFSNPQNPEPIVAELRRVLARAEPTQREAELLAAAVRALERAVRGRGGTGED